MSKRPNDPGYAAGWCIHYQSPFVPGSNEQRETCEAGVRYDSFSKADRTMDRCPCFIKPDQTPADRAPCPHLRPPTPEEIRLHNEWVTNRLKRIGVAQAAIFPFRKTHKGAGTQEIDCPACKTGKLRFSIASGNGHCTARCTTDDCVGWME